MIAALVEQYCDVGMSACAEKKTRFKNNKYNLQHMAKKISTLSACVVFSFGGLTDHSHKSLQYREAASDFIPTLGKLN